MKTDKDHVVVTPPDRYWDDAYSILLLDFNIDQVTQLIEPLRGSSVPLAIHVYSWDNTDIRWLLDVANSCDTVVMNLALTTINDLAKGQLISKHNVWYTGRKDLADMWSGHTDDPLALLLIEIEKYRNSRGTQ
jgi:hypothetical protein